MLAGGACTADSRRRPPPPAGRSCGTRCAGCPPHGPRRKKRLQGVWGAILVGYLGVLQPSTLRRTRASITRMFPLPRLRTAPRLAGEGGSRLTGSRGAGVDRSPWRVGLADQDWTPVSFVDFFSHFVGSAAWWLRACPTATAFERKFERCVSLADAVTVGSTRWRTCRRPVAAR